MKGDWDSKDKKYTNPVSGDMGLSESIPANQLELKEDENFPLYEMHGDWHSWEYWAGLIAGQFDILSQGNGWDEQISWSRSDPTGWALLSLRRLFQELGVSCHNQVVLIEMLSILQRPFKGEAIRSTIHPLHLEYLRISNLIKVAPSFEFIECGEEE